MKTILKLKLLVILVSYYTLFFVFFESLYYTLGQPFLLRMYIGYINPDYFKIVKNVYRVFFFFIIVLKKKFFRLHDKRKSIYMFYNMFSYQSILNIFLPNCFRAMSNKFCQISLDHFYFYISTLFTNIRFVLRNRNERTNAMAFCIKLREAQKLHLTFKDMYQL